MEILQFTHQHHGFIQTFKKAPFLNTVFLTKITLFLLNCIQSNLFEFVININNMMFCMYIWFPCCTCDINVLLNLYRIKMCFYLWHTHMQTMSTLIGKCSILLSEIFAAIIFLKMSIFSFHVIFLVRSFREWPRSPCFTCLLLVVTRVFLDHLS